MLFLRAIVFLLGLGERQTWKHLNDIAAKQGVKLDKAQGSRNSSSIQAHNHLRGRD